MKRYIVFGYYTYYPKGGSEDIIGIYETIEQVSDVTVLNWEEFDTIEVYDILNDTAEYPKLDYPKSKQQ